MSFTIIADTGLQFLSTEVSFNPSEPVQVNDMPLPGINFIEYPSSDGTADINCLELAFRHQGKNYSMAELRSQGCVKQVMNIAGETSDKIDVVGKPEIDVSKVNPANLWDYASNQSYMEFNMEGSFQVAGADGEVRTPFELVLGKWLPVPMFVKEGTETHSGTPTSWCRVRIDMVEAGKKANRYRLTWAFDTTTSSYGDDDPSQPSFPSNTHVLEFGICNRIPQYLSFLQDNPWVGDYMGQLIYGEGVIPANVVNGFTQRARHLAFYISLFTQLRNLPGAGPDVKLFNTDLEEVKVDLVLDIGNSRTCGVLYENHDLTTGTLMNLRDISEPWRLYKGSFDMRLAFHKAEFGAGNMGAGNVFNWRSFVRIGPEAMRLISNEQLADGLSARLTHHSSPKRYLWDDSPYSGRWEFLLTEGEPVAAAKDAVYVQCLSEQFRADGSFRTADDPIGGLMEQGNTYSRRALMTMVMIEIIRQAMMQVNSFEYLDITTGRGLVDRRRVIDNIIVTCPTGMSRHEQAVLRGCAKDAMIAIRRSQDPNVLWEAYDAEKWEGLVNVIPSEKDLAPSLPGMPDGKENWGYDEATCCQMVYLYSEIASRYRGDCRKFIEIMGHERPELREDGYDCKSLTVGSIDIGAGTTDLMVCTYKYNQHGNQCTLIPVPLFWDSFHLAGDDLLQEIVMRVVIREPRQDNFCAGLGSICNAYVCHRAGENLTTLTPEELSRLRAEAHAQVVGFFGHNAPALSELDRIMRNDFNVQISVPIAQKMMDMMKNMDVAREVTFDEIFAEHRPSQHLLDFFYSRFGFRVEELRWAYSPEVITECIRSRIEPLLKQLSIILSTYQCDVVLLAGRPTSLEAITDLLLKFFPVSPDRLIRLLPKNDNFLSDEKKWNCYKVGRWFPSADKMGYFRDLKPVVAVGAVVAYKAEKGYLPNFRLDMSQMRLRMTSTANFIGVYDSANDRVHREDVYLSPERNTFTFRTALNGSPTYLACKQINTEYYQARPLYALRVRPGADISGLDLSDVRITISRIFTQDKEMLTLQNAIDRASQPITDLLELRVQSLVTADPNGSATHWLDKGEFYLN